MDDDIWVYLDTNVVISLAQALDGTWRPPPAPLERSDRQRLAAARLLFYGYRERWTRWYLVTSTEARGELRSDSVRWLDSMLLEADRTSDQFPPGDLEREAARYEAAGVKAADARHLAVATLRPWIRLFVTDDDRFRKGASRAGVPSHLRVVTSEEAVELLQIESGEQPLIAPLATSPLASQTWWIPGAEYS